MTYYKATRPDGYDFHTGAVDYAAALADGTVVEHPSFDLSAGPSGYLSVATVATDCTGMSWPCRLFLVEPVGEAHTVDDLPNKRAVAALRVVEERPAHEALGPQGEHVAALFERARRLTSDEARRWVVARDAARAAAWDAARGAARAAARDAARAAARDAARDAAGAAARAAARDAAGDAARAAARDAARAAARDAARDAAGAAAWALVVRDLIDPEQYRFLVAPWASVCGWPHPDDEARYGEASC